MKKYLFIVMGIFSLLMLTSCSSDDETTGVSINNETSDKNGETKGKKGEKTPTGSIDGVIGHISYNNDLQAWHFFSTWPYTYLTHDYYTINLGDDFKIDWLLVTISGNIFIDKVEQRSYIEITKIEKCSSDMEIMDKDGFFSMDIEECYSGCVADAKDDKDSIKVQITEAPENLSLYDPRKGASIYILKSDIQNPNIVEGDVVDFRIIRYKALSLGQMGGDAYIREYFCNVKPCK